MEGREKPQMDKYRETIGHWYYHARSMLTSPPVWAQKNFTHLTPVAPARSINSEIKFVDTKIFKKKKKGVKNCHI